MQVSSESGRWYIPLIPVILLSVLCNYSPGHSICLMSFTVIYFVGVGEQLYYNMAVAILLGFTCIIFNFHQAYIMFSQCTKSDGNAMMLEIITSWTTYFLLIEGVYLIVAIFEGIKKYDQFRAETYALLSEQY